MAALTCDICGGNLTMNESGEFAICESCGMKHDKRRVQAKVQEITGVVEVTKGEAEKERLLKNAETFLSLADFPKALEIYKQIANDYPNEVRSWMGIAECCFLRLPKQYAKDELTQAGTDISSIYFELLEAQKKAVILDATSQGEVDALWKKHQEKVEKYSLELMERYQNDDCLEDVLLDLLYPNCFIPRSKQKLLSQLKENAVRLEKEIRNPQCYKRIYGVEVACAKTYADSVYGMSNIVHSPVECIEYLASQEAIVSYKRYGHKSTYYIRFNKNYSVEELACDILKPTVEEKKHIEKLQLLKSFLDNIPDLSEFIREERHKSTESKYYKTSYDVYNVRTLYNFDVSKGEPFLTIAYNYSANEYDKSSKNIRRGIRKNGELNFNGEELNKIKIFCKDKNLCIHCGGEFKGVFKKVCSKCGKPKDY